MLDPVAPEGQSATDYDQRHLLTYAELLDADADGVSWIDGSLSILGLDPREDPVASQICWQSHLARARWIRDAGLGLAIQAFGSTKRSVGSIR